MPGIRNENNTKLPGLTTKTLSKYIEPGYSYLDGEKQSLSTFITAGMAAMFADCTMQSVYSTIIILQQLLGRSYSCFLECTKTSRSTANAMIDELAEIQTTLKLLCTAAAPGAPEGRNSSSILVDIEESKT